MKIEKINNGALKQNCYVLSKEDGTCFIIDPGLDKKKILQYILDNKLNPQAVILTHGHFDHIHSAKELKDLGAKIYITEIDAPKLMDNELNMGFLFGVKTESILPDGFLVEGENEIGGEIFNIIFTPGHTSGSCVIIYGNNIFTGDTYFEDGVYGRTDLLDGNQKLIEQSLEKLKPYLKDKIIHPGH